MWFCVMGANKGKCATTAQDIFIWRNKPGIITRTSNTAIKYINMRWSLQLHNGNIFIQVTGVCVQCETKAIFSET